MNNIQILCSSVCIALLYPRGEFKLPLEIQSKAVHMAQVQPELFGCSISINHASKEQLMTLPHIGPSRAEQIITQRNKHYFEQIEDLLKVRGIGEQRLKQIKEHVELDTTKCHPFAQQDLADLKRLDDKTPGGLQYLKIEGVTRYR